MFDDYALIFAFLFVVLIAPVFFSIARKTKKKPLSELFIPEDKWS